MYYTEHYAVSSHDVDVNNNIRPSIVLRFMQETANHQMRDGHPSYQELFFSGQSFVVSRVSIEILKQLHQYDEIESRCWTCEGKAATFRRCYQLFREGELCAQAYSEWALTDIRKGGLIRTTDIDFSSYPKDAILDLPLPKRFRLPKTLELQKMGEDRVRYSDVDMNGHMNNTYYPDVLWNCIPNIEEKCVTSLNVHFVHEARLGTPMEIYGSKADRQLANDRRAEEVYAMQSRMHGGEKNVEALFGLRRLDHPLWDEEEVQKLKTEE